MTDQPLPSNLNAERSVLGGIMLESDLIHQAGSFLLADDFSLDAHRRIFGAMVGLAAEQKPIDQVSLTEELARRRELDAVGGAAYVMALTDGVARRQNLDHHVKLIREKSQLRRIIHALTGGMARAYEQDATAEEIAADIQNTLFEVQGDAVQAEAKHVSNFIPRTIQELEAQSKHDGLVGLPTGVPDLDRTTTGIRPGELWVVGALPGRGKTALGTQIAGEAAANGTPTAIFELEMNDTELGRRLLTNRTTIGPTKIRTPYWMDKDNWNELSKVSGQMVEWPLWVDDAAELNTRQLAARARLYIRKHKVRLIIVDYLMLIEEPEEKEARHKARRIANTLRRVAKEETKAGRPVSIVLLSQLSRPKDKNINAKPTMLDLRESGDIEAAAYVVVLIFMEVDEQGKFTGNDELIVGKNRNGAIGSIPVHYEKRSLKFEPRLMEVMQ